MNTYNGPPNIRGDDDGMDIEDSPSPSHDYVLPDDIQDLAEEVADLETSLAELRHTIWDDD